MYNFSLRSLEEPINADEEENAGPGQAEHMCLQVSQQHLCQSSCLGWLCAMEGFPFIHLFSKHLSMPLTDRHST